MGGETRSAARVCSRSKGFVGSLEVRVQIDADDAGAGVQLMAAQCPNHDSDVVVDREAFTDGRLGVMEPTPQIEG
jgi:hypothetical protein